MGIKLYFLLSALLGNNLLKDSCAKMGSLSARKKRTYYLYYYIMLFSNFIGGTFAAKIFKWWLNSNPPIISLVGSRRTEVNCCCSSKASNLTSRVRWQIALDNCFPTRGYHKAKDHQRWKSPSSVQKICAQTLMRYTENSKYLCVFESIANIFWFLLPILARYKV